MGGEIFFLEGAAPLSLARSLARPAARMRAREHAHSHTIVRARSLSHIQTQHARTQRTRTRARATGWRSADTGVRVLCGWVRACAWVGACSRPRGRRARVRALLVCVRAPKGSTNAWAAHALARSLARLLTRTRTRSHT